MFTCCFTGNAYLLHIIGGADQIIGLIPLHPLSVQVLRLDAYGNAVKFRATLIDGTVQEFTSDELTHITGAKIDRTGYGYSPLSVLAMTFAAAIAGEKAAGNQFNNGAMIAGLVVPVEGDMDPEAAAAIQKDISAKLGGVNNAGALRIVNTALKILPYTMTAADSQFIEQRSFQVEEVARIYGIPPHLLMAMEKSTSFGAGIEQQTVGLGRHTLNPWAKRIEGRLSRLLGMNECFEFDFTELEAPAPSDQINLLMAQVNGGLITLNEARRIQGLPDVPGGDVIRLPAGSLPVEDQQPTNDNSEGGN